MKTISDYIESLFLGIGETDQIRQLKEDLLAGAEDRYEDLKNQGKSENEAIGGVIAEFGTIDELLEEMNIKQEFEEETGYELNEITLEEAVSYLNKRRKAATMIGLGVLIIMLGVAANFALMGIYGENTIEIFGLLLILIGSASGVPLFIIAGTSLSNENKKLSGRFIPIVVKNEMKKRKDFFHRSFVFCIATGVVLCILSVIPVIVLSELSGSEKMEIFGIALFLTIAGLGIFFFIFGGVIMGSFTKIIESAYFISGEDELGPNTQKDRDKIKPGWLLQLESVFWPMIGEIFLIQGFLLGNWGTSWIIFPISGIIFGLLESIFSGKER
ncbi:hypothetical protein GIX45_08945 [Erwinia sp. CPCC 100877]|nr:hypothetical protein [Erwinia sp. CPCC 100877]